MKDKALKLEAERKIKILEEKLEAERAKALEELEKRGDGQTRHRVGNGAAVGNSFEVTAGRKTISLRGEGRSGRHTRDNSDVEVTGAVVQNGGTH